MLQTVRDACQFDENAIVYALSDQIVYALSDQIENLDDLFFDKTYVTGGMKTFAASGNATSGRCLGTSRVRTEAGHGWRQNPFDARS